MSNEAETIFISFVLLPEISTKKLEELYSIISDEKLNNFIKNESYLVEDENKMKVVSYCFSELVAEKFFKAETICAEKKITNDIYQFSYPTYNIYKQDLFKINFDPNVLFNSCTKWDSFSKFSLSNVVGSCYNVIISSKKNEKYFDLNHKNIDEIIVSHDDFDNALKEEFEDSYFWASCVIDIFIDRGMMVPTIVHSNGGIIRAYKMGEYSKLTKSQIDDFAAMLYNYQEYKKSALDKTELENELTPKS